MIRRFLGALQFLTILPIRGATVPAGQAAVFFPIVGALLGAGAALVFQLCILFWSRSLASLFALLFLLCLTGCLHEDGLADVADALRAGRTRERMLQILKESSIGVYGGLALVISVAVRWQALAESQISPLLALTVSLALSRSTLVILAGTTPSFGAGLGRSFAEACSHRAVATVLVQAAVSLVMLGLFADWKRAVAVLIAAALVIIASRTYFLRRLNGVNGDCLGAACQLVEIASLIVLACNPYR